MKIAIVYDVAYPWHVGGVEYGLHNEAKELAKEHEVHFFCMQWPGMKNDFKSDGIRYHAAPAISQKQLYTHGRRSIREALNFRRGLKNLNNYEFDVVITNFFPIVHLPVVYSYCRKHNVKMVMEVAEIWSREYWKSYLGGFLGGLAYWYSRRQLKGANFYVANSSSTLKDLLANGVAKNMSMSYCPVIDDIGLKKMRKSFGGERESLVIFAGRMIKEKRLDKWLKALDAARLRDPKIKGLIVGEGPEMEDVEMLVRERGMQDSVTVRKFYDNKKDYYRQLAKASLLLNMSEREGLSIVAMESVALGTPVVLPDYSPIPQEIKQMCVVKKEEDIPGMILEITKMKNKNRYIREVKNLDAFSVSRVGTVYKDIFRKVGRSPS